MAFGDGILVFILVEFASLGLLVFYLVPFVSVPFGLSLLGFVWILFSFLFCLSTQGPFDGDGHLLFMF